MRVFKIILAVIILLPLAMGLLFLRGWWTFHHLQKSIVEKMDRYYLDLSTPGREEYLLENDEVFEVPYMASKLSIEAAPSRIYDASGRLIGEFSRERALYARSPAELPVFLKKAVVATEDGAFYAHHGLDYRAMVRALWKNLSHLRKAQGGSTITQQLAKMMFTTRQKTLGRKIFEAFCARRIEGKFTKDQILLMYLNFAYFGHGCFGIESAARFYFGKTVRDLDLAEAALLAGIINSPNRFSPYENPALAQARHRIVLSRMVKKGWVPAALAQSAWEDFWKSKESSLRSPESSFWRTTVNESPYLIETVRRALEKDFSKERILKGGLRVRTTFDLKAQKAAEAAMRAGLAPGVQGGLAALSPKDGAILALVGGSGFNFSNQLNRAVNISRPVGSAIKPFIYAVAFESGKFTPADKMLDAPVHFKNWSPQNYNRKYYGPVTLAEALHRSLNSVAVRLLDSISIDAVIRLLSEATGIPRRAWPRNLTLALGTADLSPVQLAGAYAIFDNGGHAVRPYFITSVEDRAGSVLKSGGPQGEPAEILSPKTCGVMIAVMQGVFGPEGTAHAAASQAGFSLPAAGKTGTTNEYRDAWFAGVTPDLSAAVWVGHDDMRVPLAKGETGGRYAAPIWIDFVKRFYRDRPTRQFP